MSMKQIIDSILSRGCVAFSPLMRTKMICIFSPPSNEYNKSKLITYNDSRNPHVERELPGITTKSCFFDSRYNGTYTKEGILIPCSALTRGKLGKLYNSPEKINIYRKGEKLTSCIYGGILFGEHYGHLLTETMSRLWPLLDAEFVNKCIDTPILFRIAGVKQSSLENIASFAKSLLKTLGIWNRILIPAEQIYVENMFIPHASIINNCMVNKVYIELMQELGRRLLAFDKDDKKWSNKKIYISRSKLPNHMRRLANEEKLEKVLESKGYIVVHPQKVSLLEQIKIFSKVDEIVGPIGSSFHTLPLVDNPDLRIKYLVDVKHSILKGTTFNNIDAALGNNSSSILCLYPNKLSLKKKSFQDQIIDLDRAVEGILEASGTMC